MTTRISKDRSAPLWAVLGAPLVGVPIMVGLLSLVAPKTAGPAASPEVGAAAAVEQVHVQVEDTPLQQDSQRFDSVFLGG